jgi:ribonuclease BN (tRNA processing enzyme)
MDSHAGGRIDGDLDGPAGDAMTVTVLGSCGSWPAHGRACSGYLVRTATTTIVVDMGSGTLANLQGHLAPSQLPDIDAVVLSHAHADHWMDLTGLAVGLRYYLNASGIPLYAGPDTIDAARQVHGELTPPFDVFEVHDADIVTVGDVRLTFSATDHSVPTLAVRFDGPAGTVAYTADTGPNWSLEALGDGIDVALCEATFTDDNHAAGVAHLTARQAGAMARAAGVGELVITHLAPGTDPDVAAVEAADAFGAPVTVASDGLVVPVARIGGRAQT